MMWCFFWEGGDIVFKNSEMPKRSAHKASSKCPIGVGVHAAIVEDVACFRNGTLIAAFESDAA